MNRAYTANLQRHIVEAAITNSALRNQGSGGVISAARSYLVSLDIKTFRVIGGGQFRYRLDEVTDQIVSSFPVSARNWGAGRKAINLFLRSVVYNRELKDHYDISHIKKWLEVPLDKDVASGLRDESSGNSLPKWNSIKKLMPIE